MATLGCCESMQRAANSAGDLNDSTPALPQIFRQFVERAPGDDVQVGIPHDLLKMSVIIGTDWIDCAT